jgi:hypothetical protein
MYSFLSTIILLSLFVFLFFREDRLERRRYLEDDRLADEHILREIEKFRKERNSCTNL